MNIGILGSGAYGIALASIAASNKNNVTIWAHREEERDNLDYNRVSSK